MTAPKEDGGGRRVSSGAVVFRRGPQGVEVALVSLKDGKKKWSLPKGLKEPGENLARAAHREVAEETGLDGRIIRLIDSIKYFYTHVDERGPKRVFKIVYFFLMEQLSGDTSLHDAEVEECRWFPIDEAKSLMTFDDERRIIELAREMISNEVSKR